MIMLQNCHETFFSDLPIRSRVYPKKSKSIQADRTITFTDQPQIALISQILLPHGWTICVN